MTHRARDHQEPEPEVVTVSEVAAMLRVSRATVYRLLHAGALPGMRVGRSLRVTRRAVDSYLRDSALHGPPPDAHVPSRRPADPAR